MHIWWGRHGINQMGGFLKSSSVGVEKRFCTRERELKYGDIWGGMCDGQGYHRPPPGFTNDGHLEALLKSLERVLGLPQSILSVSKLETPVKGMQPGAPISEPESINHF